MHRCNVMEKCARNIAVDHSGIFASEKDYIEPMENMGEAGQTAISNFRPNKKEKKIKVIKEKKIKKNIENMRVPVIINISKDEIDEISKIPSNEKKKFIFNIVKDTDEKLYKYITNTAVEDPLQMSTPISDNSYKKHITDIVNKNKKNKPCTIDLKPKTKEVNNWQVFIDNRENRLCFVIWVVDQLLY